MYKPFTLTVLAVACLTAALFLSACTFTTSIPKPPVYGEPMDSLRAQVTNLVTCEHFDIEGHEKTTNGRKGSEVDITIVNGQGIPEGMEKWDLGRALAGVVKRSLQDTTEYELYTVSFATEKKDGMSFSKKSTSREFLLKDL